MKQAITGGVYRAAFAETWRTRAAAKNPYNVFLHPRRWAAHYDGVQAAMAGIYSTDKHFRSVRCELKEGFLTVSTVWIITGALAYFALHALMWVAS